MTDRQTYNSIVSLGYFCSVAMENERIGYRNFSLPMDWLIVDNISTIIHWIQTNFQDFLMYDNLQQEVHVDSNYYYDEKNKTHFYHDFISSKSLAEQIDAVQAKYNRRISRFYEVIKSPTLFVRYCSDSDVEYIKKHYAKILNCLRSFNENNMIIFVCDNTNVVFDDEVMTFYVQKDKNDMVSRQYLKKNKSLYWYIRQTVNISKKTRRHNLLVYRKKKIKKMFSNVKAIQTLIFSTNKGRINNGY